MPTPGQENLEVLENYIALQRANELKEKAIQAGVPPMNIVTGAPTIGLATGPASTTPNPPATEIGQLQQNAENADNATANIWQSMIDQRKAEAKKEQTDNYRMATFNALGNFFRNVTQPLGWAAGGGSGVTAPVQPYDNRQYLESFNRAIKAGDDLRNIGAQDMQFKLEMAKQKAQRAWNEYDHQRRREETLEDYGKRIAMQLSEEGSTNSEFEKRRTIALKAYYDLIKSDSIHKSGYPSFKEYIKLEGLGKELFGDWNPTDEEVEAVVQAISGSDSEPKGVKAASNQGQAKGGTTSTGKPSSTGSSSSKNNKTGAIQSASSSTATNKDADKWAGYNKGGRLIKNRIAQNGGAQAAQQQAASPATTQAQPEARWGGKKKKKD